MREDIEKKRNKTSFLDRLSGNAINWLHAYISGYTEGYKCEMNRILDELVKRIIELYLKYDKEGIMEENEEEWSRIM